MSAFQEGIIYRADIAWLLAMPISLSRAHAGAVTVSNGFTRGDAKTLAAII